MNETKSWMEERIERLEAKAEVTDYDREIVAGVISGLNSWDALSVGPAKAKELLKRAKALR